MEEKIPPYLVDNKALLMNGISDHLNQTSGSRCTESFRVIGFSVS